MSKELALITGDIYASKDAFNSVLTDKNVNFDKEAAFAIQILQNNDYALGVALKNRQSVVDAVTNVAAIGISLNPAKKQAYLVPRKNKICLDISYIGLLDLAVASGSILWGQPDLVRETDTFHTNGFDKAPTHLFNPFSKERGAIVGTYVVVKTSSGDYLTTTMTIEECYDIRARSEGFKSGRNNPWVTDEGEMIKKTVIKRASKLWPKTDRLDRAVHYLNTDGSEGLVLHQQTSNDEFIDVTPFIAGVKETKTDEEALAYWKANAGLFVKQKTDYTRFKNEAIAHRTALKEASYSSTIEMNTQGASDENH